jgi:peroxiredoxin
MKRFSICFLSILLCCPGLNFITPEPQAGTPYLSGTVEGFKDSTLLYLEEFDTIRFKDSALIIKGQFSFTRKIDFTIPAIYVLLRTKDASDYKFIWLEQQPAYFNGAKGNFKNATVEGSPSQICFEQLVAAENPVRIIIDSLRGKYGDLDPVINQRIVHLKDSIQLAVANIIKTNPTSIVSLKWVDGGKATRGRLRTQALYDLLSTEQKVSVLGMQILEFIELNADLSVGDNSIDFCLPNPSGQTTCLSDLSGNFILLEFWSSSCGPCRRENPHLVKLYEQYRAKGFAILGVSLDEKESLWKKAIAADKLPWPQVSGLNGYNNTAAMIYGVYEIPTNYLIDQEGRIIAKNLRGEQLKQKLKELLGE